MIPAPTWTPTAREYHADLSAWSSSMLRTFRRSPALAEARYVTRRLLGDDATGSQRLGSAVNVLLLQPELEQRLLLVADADTRSSTAFRRTRRHAPREALVLTIPEYDQAVAIARAVREGRSEMAALARVYLLELPGYAEYAFRWTDETGVPCKAMVDRLVEHPAGPVKVELKTDQDPLDAFSATATKWGYHCQSAFNARGLRAALGIEPMERIVVVRNEPPHEVVVYEPDAEWLEAGAATVAADLERLAYCLATGEWLHDAERLDVSGGCRPLSLPRHMRRRT